MAYPVESHSLLQLLPSRYEHRQINMVSIRELAADDRDVSSRLLGVLLYTFKIAHH